MQQQTIAVFGATTAAGIMLCTRLATSPHKLLLSPLEVDTGVEWLAIDLQKHFPMADIEVAHCEVNAAWEADIIIATVTTEQLPGICAKIKAVACRKIFALVTDAARAEVSQLCITALPHSKHVNIITEWSGNESAVYLHGTDDGAINRIAHLLDEAGIKAVSTSYHELARA